MDCWADLLDWMVKREQFDLLVAVRLERFDTRIITLEVSTYQLIIAFSVMSSKSNH
jgi:hypothetical protein